MNEQYAVQLGDSLYAYYLLSTKRGEGIFFADGVEMIPLRRAWFTTDHLAERIEEHIPGGTRVTHYAIRNPDIISPALPPELTPEEMGERQEGEDDEVYAVLYQPVRAQDAGTVVEHPGPYTLLVAEWGEGGRVKTTWKAELPYELRERAEYAHLFPGHLMGFQERVIERLKALPHIKYVLARKGGNILDVTAEIGFLTNISHWVSKNSSPRERTVTKKWELHVPKLVWGECRAAAEAEWDRLLEGYLAEVDCVNVRACNTCEGHGFVLVPQEWVDAYNEGQEKGKR